MDGINGKVLLIYTVSIGCFFWAMRISHEHWLSQTPVSIRFCDVGQGDGAHIRISPDIDILIDTGPDESILECLGKGMPYADKDIDLILLTHFQRDHTGGLFSVLQRYHVSTLILPPYSDSQKKIDDVLSATSGSTKTKILKANDEIRYPGVTFSVLWPKATARSGQGSLDTISITDEDLNITSYILSMTINSTTNLFTGDTHGDVLDRLRNTTCNGNPCIPPHISILKAPHHGAKNGVDASFYDQTQVDLAVVSAGERNTFGHPSKTLLDTLAKHHIPKLITFQTGDIWINLQRDGAWEYVPQSPFWKMLQ